VPKLVRMLPLRRGQRPERRSVCSFCESSALVNFQMTRVRSSHVVQRAIHLSVDSLPEKFSRADCELPNLCAAAQTSVHQGSRGECRIALSGICVE
jgi:hypothetical protein